jgi:ribonuclease P protein component
VLPPAHRLRTAAEFRAVVRGGRRASRPLLTVHLLPPPTTGPTGNPSFGPSDDPSAVGAEPAPARAGRVVSKAVGGAVARHRTSRRLRHLLLPHLAGPAADVPAGAGLVVRAAPTAGTAPSSALGADLDSALAQLLRPRPGAST